MSLITEEFIEVHLTIVRARDEADKEVEAARILAETSLEQKNERDLYFGSSWTFGLDN